MTAVYRFGRFELSPATRQLLVDNQPVPLGARAFDVLAALIERRERLVTKNELLDLVWPGLVVEENNLQTQVSALRKLLGRDAIATVPGLGYRFALETAHAVVPALTQAVTPTNNLPQQLTSFVGRELALVAIRELLTNTRLLTLVGVGGLGKTRLSLQLGAEALNDFPDGVWFVELAPLTDGHRVPEAVASALGVKEEAGRPVIDALVKHVKDRRMLLILDNCEHLTRACAALAKNLLQSGPGLKVLASSREHLRVAGETSYPVPALAAPGMRQTIPLAALAQYEAVRLFVDRAIAAQPLFKLTPQNATEVTEICHRLDGIPLAIELAAARVRALTAETIAAHLSDSFRLLTGGDTTSLPRHQTLRACMDWSYDLLAAPERALLRRLAVFGGGWTMEAAAAVGAVGEVDEFDVLETLTHLVDKCLVTFDGERYGLLETVRQYGRDKLLKSGELEAMLERHRDLFLALAEEAEPQLIGTEQVKWFNRLAIEHDNLRLAIGCALQRGKAEEAQRLAGALARFWGVRGHWTEGRDWLKRALEERKGVSKAVQAKALRWAGNLGHLQGDDERARELYEEALAIYRELGDVQGVAGTLNNLGNLEVARGDYERGRELYEEALAIKRELGDQLRFAISLINLGSLVSDQGGHEKARAMLEEALAICRTLGDELHIVIALNSLGNAAVGRNSIHAARSYMVESLLLSGEQGNRLHMIISLSGLAWVFEKNGQANVAAQLQGACTRGLEEMGGVLERVDHRVFDTTKDALIHALGEDGYQAAFVKGKELSLEQARALALNENPGNSRRDAAG